jgi:small ligand-binding sensory domain FIST
VDNTHKGGDDAFPMDWVRPNGALATYNCVGGVLSGYLRWGGNGHMHLIGEKGVWAQGMVGTSIVGVHAWGATSHFCGVTVHLGIM